MTGYMTDGWVDLFVAAALRGNRSARPLLGPLKIPRWRSCVGTTRCRDRTAHHPNGNGSRGDLRDDGRATKSPLNATVSHPSRSRRSFTARHQELPGRSSRAGASTPRRSCQRMNDIAARRYGRCRGARPNGPRYVRSTSAIRADGSSRTAVTCSSAHTAAADLVSTWTILPGTTSIAEPRPDPMIFSCASHQPSCADLGDGADRPPDLFPHRSQGLVGCADHDLPRPAREISRRPGAAGNCQDTRRRLAVHQRIPGH
jgi:hypothetical protein